MKKGNKERYSYLAVFHFDEDGISIEFPDLPGCYSAADTSEEAFINAEEALGLHLWGLEEDGDDIPEASRLEDIKKDEDSDVISLITVFMPPIRDAINRKAIKKTLTIPAWLANTSDEDHVNYSQVLQKALMDYLGVYTEEEARNRKKLAMSK